MRHANSIITVVTLAAAMAMQACDTFESNSTTSGQQPASSRASGTSQSTGADGAATGAYDATLRTAVAYPTGDRNTSILLLERVVPTEIPIGQQFSYQVILTNLRDATLQNVTVTDTVATTYTHRESTPQASVGEDGSLTWHVGDLQPRQSSTINVTGTASAAGALNSCTGVTYNTMLCQTSRVVEPDLAVTLAGPESALLCDTITYRMIVNNPGTGAATNVEVRADLPPGLVLQSQQQASVKIDALAAGESREITLPVKADATGEYVVKAIATADGGLDALSESAQTVVRQPVLEISATAAANQFIGRQFQWTITVKNTGDAGAEQTVVTAPLPSNASFVSATPGGTQSGSSVTWPLGRVSSGETRTLTLLMQPTTAGDVAVNATVQAVCADSVSTPLTTTIVGIPALLLEVVDSADPIEIGNEVVYTIEVLNQGTAPATNVTIVCELPEGEQFISGTGATGATSDGSTIRFAAIESLQPKSRATWRIVVRAAETGDMRFRVRLDSDQLASPVEETESTMLYE